MTLWESIQDRVWTCEACKGNTRVQLNIRQQTPAPIIHVSLLFVGIAPPDQGRPAIREIAKSATKDPEDKLRQFIEETANLSWEHLLGQGGFLIHAVKCAIVPDADGFQNPPTEIVDRCSSIGFADELQVLQPARIVAFGGAARRAILKNKAVTAPHGVGVSKTFAKLHETWPKGIPCRLGNAVMVFHPAPFPRSPTAKTEAARIVREALVLAGIA